MDNDIKQDGHILKLKNTFMKKKMTGRGHRKKLCGCLNHSEKKKINKGHGGSRAEIELANSHFYQIDGHKGG